MGINSGIDLDELIAEDVEFDPTGYRLRATDVQGAIQELRNKLAFVPYTTTTTASGNLTLINTSGFEQIILGTADGFSVTLPDATTMFTGERFEIINGSTKTIQIKDNVGTVLAEVITTGIATLYLTTNFTAAGTWQAAVVNGAATGILSYSVGSDTTFSTSSTTDILVTDISVTPVSGRYQVLFSADINIAKNKKLNECVFYKGGVAVSRSRRTVQGVGRNFRTSQNLLAEITVNGSEAIDVRTNINAGSVDINQRRMILIRLGS